MERSLEQKQLARKRDSFDSSSNYNGRRTRVALKVPHGHRLPKYIMKECFDPATGQNSFKLFKKIGQAIKKGTKKFIDINKKIVKGVVKVNKAIVKGSLKLAKKGLQAVGEATKMAILLPFLPIIKTALKKKLGKDPGNNPKKLVENFYNVFIAKKPVNFDSFDERTSSIAFLALIPPVIAFVKSLIHKRKKGGSTGDAALDAGADVAGNAIEQAEAKAKAAGLDITDLEAPATGAAMPTNMKNAQALGAKVTSMPEDGSDQGGGGGMLDGDIFGISKKYVAIAVVAVLLIIVAKKFF